MNGCDSDKLKNYDELLEGLIKLSLNTDTEKLIRSIFKSAKEIIHTDLIHIRVSDNFEDRLTLAYCDVQNDANNNPRFKNIKTDEAIAGYAFTNRISVNIGIHEETNIGKEAKNKFAEYIRDLAKDEKNNELIEYLKTFKHCIVVPLLLGKKPIGVLTAIRTKGLGFSDENKEFLGYLADQATIALRNTWLFEATKWKPSKPDVNIETLCKEVIKESVKKTFSGDGRVRFVNWDEKTLVPGALVWEKDSEVDQRVSIRRIGMCPAGTAARFEYHYKTNDLQRDRHFKTFKGFIKEYRDSYEQQKEKIRQLKGYADRGELNKLTNEIEMYLKKSLQNPLLFDLNFSEESDVSKSVYNWEEFSKFIQKRFGIDLKGEERRIEKIDDNTINIHIEKKVIELNDLIKDPDHVSLLTNRDKKEGPDIVEPSRENENTLHVTIDGNGPDKYTVKNNQVIEEYDLLLRYDDIRNKVSIKLHDGRNCELIKKENKLYSIENIDLYDRMKLLEELIPKPDKYLFRWEEIPGNENERLIHFLKSKYDVFIIDKIEKDKNDMTISITSGKKSISLNINDANTEMNLEINKFKTDKFIVKTEKDKRNIYPDYLYDSITRQFNSLDKLSSAWNNYWTNLDKWNSEVAVPIIVGSKLLGVLNVHSKLEKQYFESDVAILQALASRVAIFLMAHQQKVLNKINEIEQRLIVNRNTDIIAEQIAEGIKEVAFFYDEKSNIEIFPLLYICKSPMTPQSLLKEQDFGDNFRFIQRNKASEAEMKLLRVSISNNGLGFQAIRELARKIKKSSIESTIKSSDTIFIVRENIDDPINRGSESAQKKGVISTACLPLAFQGIVYGLLYIHVKIKSEHDKIERYFFTQIEKDVITLFAVLASVVLKNLKQNPNLETYDNLCGLYLINQCAGIEKVS